MRVPSFLQPRILAQVARALISPPFPKRFPSEPLEPVEGFRGRPRFDESGCIGCGACAEVCPPKCIDVIDDIEATPPKRRLVQHLDACIWCGQCERHCPTRQGIRLTSEYDCVGFAPEDFEERVEKERGTLPVPARRRGEPRRYAADRRQGHARSRHKIRSAAHPDEIARPRSAASRAKRAFPAARDDAASCSHSRTSSGSISAACEK